MSECVSRVLPQQFDSSSVREEASLACFPLLELQAEWWGRKTPSLLIAGTHALQFSLASGAAGRRAERNWLGAREVGR